MVLLSFPLVLLSVDVCSECLLPIRSGGAGSSYQVCKIQAVLRVCVCVCMCWF